LSNLNFFRPHVGKLNPGNLYLKRSRKLTSNFLLF